MSNPLLDRLRHHVTGAIERGEAEPILARIKIWQPDETEASACLLIQCFNTGKIMRWNDAVRAGWAWDYDAARKPNATTRYYSPEEQ